MKFVVSHTLGYQQKKFEWFIENSNCITIKRAFQNGVNERLITSEELSLIHEYVKNHKDTTLSNNVEKLHNGKEKEGIGKHMFEFLKWSTTDSQLASQIAALFCAAGVWAKNSKVRGVTINALKDNWQTELHTYYRLLLEKKLMEKHPALMYLRTIERLIKDGTLRDEHGGISVMHEALVRVKRFGSDFEYDFPEAKSAIEKLGKLLEPNSRFDAEGMCKWSELNVTKFINSLES